MVHLRGDKREEEQREKIRGGEGEGKMRKERGDKGRRKEVEVIAREEVLKRGGGRKGGIRYAF